MHENGVYPYEILGIREPILCDEFELHIDNICKKSSCLWNRWSSVAFCWNQGNRYSAISFYLIMEVIEENK